MLQEERLDYLIRYLLEEEQNYILDIPDTEIEKKKLLRALMNVRLPKPISQEFLNESLYLSVPPAHPLAPFKEISFSDLNGQSVLLLTRIGFWNKVCQRMIPESHLLFQDDPSVFNELTKMSALPNFRSNITIQREEAEDNRILIPITDPEAHVRYYAIYPKDKRNLFQPIIKQIKNIDWKKTKELSK